MQATTYLVQKPLHFTPASFYMQKGDLLKFDPANKHSLTVYRNGSVVKVTHHTVQGMAALERNGIIEDVNAAAARAQELAAEEAAKAKVRADEAAAQVKALQDAAAQASAIAPAPESPEGEELEIEFDDEPEDASKQEQPEFHKMNKKQILAYAQEKHPDLTIDPKAKHSEIVAALQAYTQGESAEQITEEPAAE